jgi:hypothetical protein
MYEGNDFPEWVDFPNLNDKIARHTPTKVVWRFII